MKTFIRIPAFHSGHPWFKSGEANLIIVLLTSFLLFDLIFNRVYIFVTRVAKHSSDLVKRLILIREITIKAYFLVIVGGVLVLCNSAIPSFLGLT